MNVKHMDSWRSTEDLGLDDEGFPAGQITCNPNDSRLPTLVVSRRTAGGPGGELDQAQPLSGPRTQMAVSRPSAVIPSGAITVTLPRSVMPRPVLGSTTCE